MSIFEYVCDDASTLILVTTSPLFQTPTSPQEPPTTTPQTATTATANPSSIPDTQAHTHTETPTSVAVDKSSASATVGSCEDVQDAGDAATAASGDLKGLEMDVAPAFVAGVFVCECVCM
jgi:hypothetical protein